MRCGLIAKKIGMTSVFDDQARQIPVTLLKIDNCRVLAVREQDRDGYTAVRLGLGARKEKNVSKAVMGELKKNNVTPAEKVAEFRVSADCLLPVGAELSPAHFVKGQYVDVAGTSIGKGFQGPMKRHNFAGLEASHGVLKAHRAHGSTGQCQDPGKTFKGKKMAGHMGAERVTVQNLQVVDIDLEHGLLAIKGAVPGAKGGFVYLSDAVKMPMHADAPMPAGLIKTEEVAAEAPVADAADSAKE